MSARSRTRLATAAGAAAVAALACAAAPRVLERRVAQVLGVDRRRAERMLAATRERLPATSYWLRAGSFTLASSGPAGALPARFRERPVRSLVGKLLERPGDVLFYLGELQAPQDGPCRGLVEA
jgi:hypothetical protein